MYKYISWTWTSYMYMDKYISKIRKQNFFVLACFLESVIHTFLYTDINKLINHCIENSMENIQIIAFFLLKISDSRGRIFTTTLIKRRLLQALPRYSTPLKMHLRASIPPICWTSSRS